MAIEEFVLPSVLGSTDVDEIHAKAIAEVPNSLDKAEGGVLWDFTRPTAIAVAEGKAVDLAEAIKCIFPMFTFDSNILNYHGRERGMIRKPATGASAVITFEGDIEAVIPKGYIVTTEAIASDLAIEFETVAKAVIGLDGKTIVEAKCKETGSYTNVAAGTIVVMPQPIKGINSCSNLESAYGGYDEESDDDFRQRMDEYDQTQGESFIGNDSDYKRWAEEVEGVGTARVIPVEKKGDMLTIIITDSNESVANEQLCQDVYEHIMSENDRSKRLAPTNARLVVVPAEYLTINASAIVELKVGYTLDDIKEAFADRLKETYRTAMETGIVRLKDVRNVLHNIAGVEDYGSVMLNGAEQNVLIGVGKIPYTTLDNLDFTVGEIPENEVE